VHDLFGFVFSQAILGGGIFEALNVMKIPTKYGFVKIESLLAITTKV